MANQNLQFIDQPAQPVRRQQDVVKRLIEQLSDGSTAALVQDVVLASGTNKIRHGQARAPRSVFVIANANVATWQPQKPDAQFIYVAAASGVTVDLQVWA